MTDKETMKLAFEALVSINSEVVCNSAHHEKKDRHEHDEACPVTMRYRTAIAALAERLKNPKKWVGLTGAEVNHIYAAYVGYPERMMKEVENFLKEKNGG